MSGQDELARMKPTLEVEMLRRRAARPARDADVGPVEAVFARRTRGVVSASKVGDAHAMHDGTGLSLMLAPTPDGGTEIRVARQSPGSWVGLAAVTSMAAILLAMVGYLLSDSVLVAASVGASASAAIAAIALWVRRRKRQSARQLVDEVAALLRADATPPRARVGVETDEGEAGASAGEAEAELSVDRARAERR